MAAISLLWRSQPSFDPYAWLIWARQLTSISEVPFGVASPTGWKPLPVLLNLPLAPLGISIAPVVWVWFVRTCALLCLVEAWRLGRLAAGVPAAIGAVALLVLTPQAVPLIAGGITEAVVTLLLLWGVRTHLEGRPRSAFLAGVTAALARPEMMLAAFPYGVWQAARGRLGRALVVVSPLVAALLWASGDWIGYGRPFAIAGQASTGAEPKQVQAAELPGLELLARSGDQVQVGVALVAALAFVAAIAWAEPVTRALGVVVVSVVVPVAIATQFGYPAVPRYLGPLFAVVSVAAGIGAGRLASVPGGRGARVAAGAACGAAMLVLAVPAAVDSDRADWRWYAARSSEDATLGEAIASAGGRQAVVDCGPALAWPADHHTAVAFNLDVRMAMEGDWSVPGVWRWVSTRTARMPNPSVVFVNSPQLERVDLAGDPSNREGLRTLAPAVVAVAGRDVVVDPIGRAGGWTIIQMRKSGTAPCAAVVRWREGADGRVSSPGSRSPA